MMTKEKVLEIIDFKLLRLSEQNLQTVREKEILDEGIRALQLIREAVEQSNIAKKTDEIELK